jgi:putative cardiolipin synthase
MRLPPGTRQNLFALLTLAVAGAFTSPAARADQVKALNHGDQSLSAFYLAISGAKQTIDVATFLLEPCQAAPKLLLEALLRKAKNGHVKVRLVVEAYNVKEPHKSGLPAYLAAQSDKNIEVRYYGSASLLQGDRPRSHIKALIVDGGGQASQIVGGRNWTDEYFGLSAKMNYVDQDVLITGQTAANAQKFFDELWKASSPAPVRGDGAAYGQSCFRHNARDQALARYIQSRAVSILRSRPTYNCGDAYYVTDDPNFMTGPTGGTDSLGPRLLKKHTTGLWLDFVAGTQKKLALVNQYYYPWGKFKDALASLRDAKKSVEVIANATGDIDGMPSQNAAFTCYIQSSAFQTYLGTQRVELLTSRGALRDPWSLSVPGASWRIHTKTGIRDGRDVLVSSWNIDPRSYATNLESGVRIQGCPALAADLNQEYDMLRAVAKRDKDCRACDADFVKSNLSDHVMCGGMPTFY